MTARGLVGWLGAGEPRPVYGHDATGVRMDHLVLLGDTVAELREWADALGVSRQQVPQRIRHGWTVLDALAGEPRYELDADARRFVADHPGGATLSEVGAHFGLTRGRIRQIQDVAFRKLRGELRRQGIDVEAWLYAIGQRTDQWGGQRVGEMAPRGRRPVDPTQPIRERVLALLADGERWATTALAARVGARRTSVSVALGKLLDEGLVVKTRDGRRMLYELSAEGEERAA